MSEFSPSHPPTRRVESAVPTLRRLLAAYAAVAAGVVIYRTLSGEWPSSAALIPAAGTCVGLGLRVLRNRRAPLESDDQPREAPEALTAEERTDVRARTITKTSVAAGGALIIVLHLMGLIPGAGPWFVILALLVSLTLRIDRLLARAARRGSEATPLRGLVLTLVAITAAAFVLYLVSDRQQGDDMVVVIPAFVLLVVWVIDRLLSERSLRA